MEDLSLWGSEKQWESNGTFWIFHAPFLPKMNFDDIFQSSKMKPDTKDYFAKMEMIFEEKAPFQNLACFVSF